MIDDVEVKKQVAEDIYENILVLNKNLFIDYLITSANYFCNLNFNDYLQHSKFRTNEYNYLHYHQIGSPRLLSFKYVNINTQQIMNDEHNVYAIRLFMKGAKLYGQSLLTKLVGLKEFYETTWQFTFPYFNNELFFPNSFNEFNEFYKLLSL